MTDDDGPTERDVLADLTDGYVSLSESHGDLAERVAELSATVERQGEQVERLLAVVESLANGEDLPEGAVGEAYRQGAEDGAEAGAEKAVETMDRLDPDDLPDGGADAAGDHPPRGFW